MRVSDISRWAECEAYALRSRSHPGPSSSGVAAYVGTYAHGLLAGLSPKQIESEHDNAIVFDSKTLTLAQARAQAKLIAEEARKRLDTGGWLIVEQEIAVATDDYTGHLDLRCWREGSGEAIIDLKTGQISAGWIQVGGYLNAYTFTAAVDAEWGGILHVPRPSGGRWPKATLSLRRAGPLIDAWNAWSRRITELESGGVPTRSPGMHCQRCPLTSCPVRVG